jgi:hypothetical protein
VGIKKSAKGVCKKLNSLFLSAKYKRLNRHGGSISACDPFSQVTVSLTSYGDRVKTVYLAIESIAHGLLRPKRLILYIDELAIFENLPIELKRLQDRGLEIVKCENYGPHKKYYPFILSKNDKLPFATADDDVFYPKEWLFELLEAHRSAPEIIHAHRAKRIKLIEGAKGFAPYREWSYAPPKTPSAANFATGEAGVIYPHSFALALRAAGSGFMELCPKSDDIWLHKQAISHGYKIMQIGKILDLLPIPKSQKDALHLLNVGQNQNDLQIAATYSPRDIALVAGKNP